MCRAPLLPTGSPHRHQHGLGVNPTLTLVANSYLLFRQPVPERRPANSGSGKPVLPPTSHKPCEMAFATRLQGDGNIPPQEPQVTSHRRPTRLHALREIAPKKPCQIAANLTPEPLSGRFEIVRHLQERHRCLADNILVRGRADFNEKSNV